jgi:pyridoxamine 5'-phosphate oxidase
VSDGPLTFLKSVLADALGGPGLPAPLPADPMPLASAWHAEAVASLGGESASAMALATCDASGAPAARIVLCKSIDPTGEAIHFFTNYTSRKASDLAANPRAAGVFYWERLGRQMRLEGVTSRLGDAENDRYFASRPLISRLGAWVSEQSKPLASRAELLERVAQVASRLGVKSLAEGQAIPRPPHWGGYRLDVDRVEFDAAVSVTGVVGRYHHA